MEIEKDKDSSVDLTCRRSYTSALDAELDTYMAMSDVVHQGGLA